MKPELSVVIPCFNERGNVPGLVAAIARVLATPPCATEVILADGGSTDGTAGALRAEIAARGLEQVRVLDLPPGGGYGHDILQGLAAARGEVLAWTHADLQTDLGDVFAAHAAFRALGDWKVFVKGRRQNRALLEAFFTFGMQVVVLAALRTWLSDINAQPKLFHRSFHEEVLSGRAPDDFSLDLFAFHEAKRLGYRIRTVPVVFARRQHGEAKGGGSWKGRLRLIRRTNRYIWQLGATMRRRVS